VIKNAAEAIDRLPEESELDGLIEISSLQKDDVIEINIEDNGPGFPEAARERLLEPYVTTREKGTGLGLAIVNRIILDHGGAISLQERPDKKRGALVRISLPRHAEMISSAEPEHVEAAS
ncbi:MAG: ATP-binding protein, partial [Henriciella sp.]